MESGDGGGGYRVKVRSGFSATHGFREVTAPVTVTGDGLYLVSYDSLTMAAQFDDQILPANHEKQLVIPLSAGNYRVRIVQQYDPSAINEVAPEVAHFLIELERGDVAALSDVAWRSA